MNPRFNGASMILGLLLSVAIALPASAHHSFQAEFNIDKPVSVTGTIAKVEWINPHAWLYVDVQDSDGKVTRWAFMMVAPERLRKFGLSREDRGGMKVGDPITVNGLAAKDRTSTAFANELKLADGRTVEIWNRDPNAN